MSGNPANQELRSKWPNELRSPRGRSLLMNRNACESWSARTVVSGNVSTRKARPGAALSLIRYD
jgi:hypothetical protein